MDKLLLNKKLDDLINLLMTGGVQPGELADNIFLQPYVQITYKKVSGGVVGELHFKEDANDKHGLTILRYLYSDDKKVYRIEEELGGIKTILWDREFEEMAILDQVLQIMRGLYSPSQIEGFTSTLPCHLSEYAKDKFKDIAS
ncbi:MAG: hypothetical protein GX996_03630 [Firmicutes bacterium]|nr:hypothetical protein [Bacillota bacterium]